MEEIDQSQNLLLELKRRENERQTKIALGGLVKPIKIYAPIH